MTRQALALAGMLLAVLGLAYELRLVVWLATALLAASVAWRLIESRRRNGAGQDGENRGS
jgi:membrane protein implicated in regulation of membrane protease activity